ncbi:MAG TPA: hypothetical protein V6C72_18175, partial [Chroococcales cyanobacterium]
MTELASGQITKEEGLFPALKAVQEQAGISHGVLVLETRAMKGKIGVSDGKFITGASVETYKETGQAALKRIFCLRDGSYTFQTSAIEDLADLDQGMSVRIEVLFDKSPEAVKEGRSRTDDASDEEVLLSSLLTIDDTITNLISRFKKTTTDDTSAEEAELEAGETSGDGAENPRATGNMTEAQVRKANRMKKLKKTDMRIQALSPVSPTAPPDQPKIESKEVKRKRAVGLSLGWITLAMLGAIAWFCFSHFKEIDSAKRVATARNLIAENKNSEALDELNVAIKENKHNAAAFLERG